MTIPFNFNEPAYHSPQVSEKVRANFQALSTQHRGSTPPAPPHDGYLWLDSSDPYNVKLKHYNDGTWITVIVHMETIPQISSTSFEFEEYIEFYEGNNPALFVDIDNYEFEDAAGFDKGSDRDIIFRLLPYERYYPGVTFKMHYCMDTADAGNIRLKLDYRVKADGDPVDGGTDYSQTFTVDPSNVADELGYITDVGIPPGRLVAGTEIVFCRLTRLGGSDPLDTHIGTFVLIDLQANGI